jgi:hypothetical protein
VAEGGPKGIKKIIKLMTKRCVPFPSPSSRFPAHRRVAWTKRSENIAKRGRIEGDVGYYGEALPPGHVPETIPEGDEEEEDEEEEAEGGAGEEAGAQAGEEEEEDESGDDEEEENDEHAKEANDGTKADDADEETDMANSCDLLWQGIVPRRLFHGFRFQVPFPLPPTSPSLTLSQECRSSGTARKVLEAKGIAHYWDMAMRADHLLPSADTAA